MITVESIPLTKEDVDVKKRFEFEGQTFQFRLRRNKLDEYFSLDIFDIDDVLVFNNRLTYKYEFVDSILPDLPFQIIPIDPTEIFNPAEAETEITEDNLGIEVKLATSITVT